MERQEAVAIIDEYMDKQSKNPVYTHDDDMIRRVLKAAAVILPEFKLMSVDRVQSFLYDEYKQIGSTFNDLYNETAAFIIDGKRRNVDIANYAQMLNTYMRGLKSTEEVKDSGSISANTLNSIFGRSDSVKNYGSEAMQSITVDRRLLSYADHELLASWMTRRNGISDMINTLSVFLIITRP